MSKNSRHARVLNQSTCFIVLVFFLFLNHDTNASHPQGEIRYSYHPSQNEASRSCTAMKGLKNNFCGTCMGPLATSRNDVFKYEGVWFHGSLVNRVVNCVYYFPTKPCPPRQYFSGPTPGSCKSAR